jgi:Sir2 family
VEEEKRYQVDMSDLDRKFKEFENAFAALGAAIADKLKFAFTGGANPADSYTHKPIKCTPVEAAKYLVGKKNVMIVTGAGVSAASGIPTFRGDNGFWSRSYGGVTDPTEILTNRFFSERPDFVW